MSRKPHVLLLLVASFVLGASSGLVFPLLPELQKAYHLPTWSLGLMSAATFLTNLVTQLTLAGQADRGRARLLVFGSLAISAVSLLWFALGTNLIELTAARALTGVAIGCFAPSARAIVAASDPENVGHRLGQLASTDLGGFIVGPMIGVTIVDLTSLKTPFWAFFGLLLVTLGCLLTQPFPSGRRDGPARRRTSIDLLRQRPVLVAMLLAVALFLPVGVYDSLWARYIQDRGASVLFTGLSLSVYGVPFVLLASFGGRLADRYGPVRCCQRALIVIVPLVALYGRMPTPGLVITIGFLEAIAEAVAVPSCQAAMVLACPPTRIAGGQGLAGASAQLAAGVTALIAAPVYSAFGPGVLFGATATAIAVFALMATFLGRGLPVPIVGAPQPRSHAAG
jgi:predicted MFS family arabinose efflux permease